MLKKPSPSRGGDTGTAAVRTRRTRLLLASSFALSACAGANWHPLPLPTPAPLDSKTIVEFHAKEKLVRLHGVTFSKDSVSGIPWLDHLSCDSCRVAYPLADVTAVRTGNPGAGAWVVGGPILAVFGAGLLIALLLATSGYHGD